MIELPEKKQPTFIFRKIINSYTRTYESQHNLEIF